MPSPPNRPAYHVWDTASDYGDVLAQRALGTLPEMACARRLATLLAPLACPGDRLLDVGCGVGHYYRSLKGRLPEPWEYCGLDATPAYVRLATQLWWNTRPPLAFDQGDIFALPYPEASYDTVICCNVLLHLPAIARPLSELVRVARRRVLVRTLLSDRAFRIQELRSPERYDMDGQPLGPWNYYNIYSERYVCDTATALPGVTRVQCLDDPPEHSWTTDLTLPNASRCCEGTLDGQPLRTLVNGSILQPWKFVLMEVDHMSLAGSGSPRDTTSSE